MRWTDPPVPKPGETRIVKKFLWFPKKIGKETRWLEFASWVEEYELMYGDMRLHFKDPGWWYPITWDVKTHTIKEIIE
jgi:hypothetical protein